MIMMIAYKLNYMKRSRSKILRKYFYIYKHTQTERLKYGNHFTKTFFLLSVQRLYVSFARIRMISQYFVYYFYVLPLLLPLEPPPNAVPFPPLRLLGLIILLLLPPMNNIRSMPSSLITSVGTLTKLSIPFTYK